MVGFRECGFDLVFDFGFWWFGACVVVFGIGWFGGVLSVGCLV